MFPCGLMGFICLLLALFSFGQFIVFARLAIGPYAFWTPLLGPPGTDSIEWAFFPLLQESSGSAESHFTS